MELEKIVYQGICKNKKLLTTDKINIYKKIMNFSQLFLKQKTP
jgi:hypothetical protein